MKKRGEYGPVKSFIYDLGSHLTFHNLYFCQFLSQNDLNLKDGDQGIDVGCGFGRLGLNLLHQNQMNGNHDLTFHFVDISTNMLKKAEKKAEKKKLDNQVRFYQGDGEDLSYARVFQNKQTNGKTISFQDESMQIVMSSGMLEHTENPKLALEELVRVLAPGGKIILPLVNENSFGRIASKLLNFNILPKEYIFHDQIDMRKAKVKSIIINMKILKSIYVGVKSNTPMDYQLTK